MSSIISNMISFLKQYCKTHKAFTIIILISLLTGITLFSQVTYYSIYHSENIYGQPTDSKIIVIPNFDKGRRHVRFIIPILFSYKTYDSPYKYQISISGKFDYVKNVKAKFVINDSKIINIPIRDEELNITKEEYHDENVFWDDKRKLEIQTKDAKSIKLVVELDGISGENSKYFKSETSYQVYEQSLPAFILTDILAFLLALGGP